RLVVGDVVCLLELVLEVVGGEYGIVVDLAQAAAAMRADIGIRAHEDACVADEAAQPPDGRRPLAGPLEPEGSVVLAEHPWRWQVRHQRLPHPDRSGPRAAAT